MYAVLWAETVCDYYFMGCADIKNSAAEYLFRISLKYQSYSFLFQMKYISSCKTPLFIFVCAPTVLIHQYRYQWIKIIPVICNIPKDKFEIWSDLIEFDLIQFNWLPEFFNVISSCLIFIQNLPYLHFGRGYLLVI